MKSINKFFSVIVALTFIFSACSKDLMNNQVDENVFSGGVKSASNCCINDGFDPNASYVTRGNGADGWNQVQDFIPGGQHTTYNFWLENEKGDEFFSFCGNYGSSGIGPVAGIDFLEPAQYADIVGVFNYINNKYGSIDAWSGYYGQVTNPDPVANTKLIAQYAIWGILGQEVTSGVPAIDNAVVDALANGKTAKGNIDIYFMVGANYPNDIDGIQPQIVPFCKEDPKGEIKVAKTVDGINIVAWAKGQDLSKLLSFDLYQVAGEGAPYSGKPFRTAGVDKDGIINFTELPDGWYAVVEKLTAAGKLVFEQAPDMFVEIKDGVQVGVSIDFDYDADYSIINGYGSGYTLGYPGLNNTGDIFYIGVANAKTDAAYASFCANAGSTNFDEGHGRYMITERFDTQADYIDFVKAYNYIEDKVGDLNKYRAITQIMTWYLLGAIEIPSAEFDNINWGAVAAGTGTITPILNAKAIVEDVVANYESYNGLGKIIDVVYMVSKYNPDYTTAQPQLVPIYGEPGFNNREKPKCTESYGSVTATNFGNVPAILAGLNPKNGNPFYGDKKEKDTPFVIPNSNHFVFAKVTRAQLEDDVKLELLVGNKFQVVGTGLVQLVNGNIVLTIDKFAAGSFGLIAFNKLPVPKNGNIHSQKEADLKKDFGATTGFNHDNKVSVPCPAGNDIWIYFHGDVSFFK